VDETNASGVKCSVCAGIGYYYEARLRECRLCRGAGRIDGASCILCRGDGYDDSVIQVGCSCCVGTGRVVADLSLSWDSTSRHPVC
jgi:DnaJ-class molecular chaperone